jgi:hypothetical protein
MGVFSAIGNAISKVANAVVSVAKTVWTGVKAVATAAVHWIADKAEAVVTATKKVWHSVRPYITPIRHGLLWIAGSIPVPWIQGAAIIFERVLNHLQNFSRSIWAVILDKSIAWAITAARHLKGKLQSQEEIDEAYKRRTDLSNIKSQAPVDTQRAISLLELINDYKIIQTELEKIFETTDISNIDHYLRLRATQKLLDNVEAVILTAKSIDEISQDDIFLVQMGATLLAPDPNLVDPDFARLDAIIKQRYNKKLLPFIFEEMVIAWVKNQNSLEKQWTETNDVVAKKTAHMRRLAMEQRLMGLSEHDLAILKKLQEIVPEDKAILDALAKEAREMKYYIGAAEGFLQLIEKDDEVLEREGLQYLINDAERVGNIIIACMEKSKKWEELTDDEQSLIIAFSNIFSAAGETRAQQLILIEVQ